ncbi:MAG: type II toxin-antitoxin system VapC family toxin [gamma proteobacterium symbiont of Taylorina sp.]|nr:type II toxin-antitoxin system VapC family toxin [gamma proteobacterium symbiont of Taylorina sp.]
MIGLDTNILARYYIQDKSDCEAQKQHKLAKEVLESGKPLMVCLTVILEFEWIMRGYYHFKTTEISSVFRHLLSLPHITIENHTIILKALSNFENGFDFADSLHHASYKECEQIVSFDDKKFSRRSKRFGLMPPVIVPK